MIGMLFVQLVCYIVFLLGLIAECWKISHSNPKRVVEL
jgi:hypothetical protein